MIVRLTGGLANQLFMYAFGRSLSAQRHEPLKFVWARSTWDYALDKFNAQVDLVNPPLYNPIYDEKTFAFDKDVYDGEIFRRPQRSSGRNYIAFYSPRSPRTGK